MSDLPGVFLTYGWCRVSYVILQSLARRDVPVHVGDASGLAMCRHSRRRASFSRYRNPYRDPEGFVADVAAALERTGARVLIPGHEDILPLARYRDRLPPGVILPVGDTDTLHRAVNKWDIVGLARTAGVPVPDTFKPASREELVERSRRLEYPAVVKTQLGNSAKGVYIVRGPDECLRRFDELVTTYGLGPERWPVVQAFAPGDGYGVCLLYNRGQFRAAFCERYLRCKEGTFGTSVFRESVQAPLLETYARRLLDSLGWHGVCHLDFLYEPTTGKAALIEVNPRFWGALDLAVRAGVDFPWLLYRMAVDGDVEPVTTPYRVGVSSRWILGEMLHLVNLARRGRLGAAARTVAALCRDHADGHDDYRGDDPLPLVFEFLYYGTRFLATGSTNPIEQGMIG